MNNAAMDGEDDRGARGELAPVAGGHHRVGSPGTGFPDIALPLPAVKDRTRRGPWTARRGAVPDELAPSDPVHCRAPRRRG